MLWNPGSVVNVAPAGGRLPEPPDASGVTVLPPWTSTSHGPTWAETAAGRESITHNASAFTHRIIVPVLS